MLTRILIILVMAGSYLALFIKDTLMPLQIFAWVQFVWILLLFGFGNKDTFSVVTGAVFYILGIVLMIVKGFTLRVVSIQSSVFITVILLWFYYDVSWNRTLLAIESQMKKVTDDITALKSKFTTRVESLSHLEKQIVSLLDLFEAAKDFNESLYFEQLMDILDKKVREQIAFPALTLSILLFESEKSEPSVKTMSIGRPHELNLKRRLPDSLETWCIERARKERKVIRVESSSDIALEKQSAAVKLPLWIFPLQVEEKLIGVLTVEGCSSEDFPKYELLASQLALQVKKISLYETVKQLSIIDGLTQTYVRRHFLERFEEELKRSIKRKTPLSVLMLDIDHFKSYNDQFGHLVGDKTLQEVASVVKEHVRRVDLVARYGGEEFIVAMPDVGYPTNLETAERIRSAVARKKFRLYDEETQVTVSIGVSSFPSDLDNKSLQSYDDLLTLELIQKADKAMYKAKEEGRNRVVSFEQFFKTRG